ncbi:MAG: hypothetical protein K2X36_07305, partial [Microbacteriaceae bacterium]|nr:hypothetical protein [Microbacteriaceae bacterium]
MNAPGTPVTMLTRELVARARTSAQQTGRSVYAELEALAGLEPRPFLQALGGLLRIAVVETVDMLACTPEHDLLPLASALKRGCVLLRAPDGTLVS